jgi:putative ABC transport system permease protein
VTGGLRAWAVRLAGLVTGRSRDARLAEEVRTHLDALADGHRARGLSASEARLAARRDFGGVEQVAEAHRDQHRVMWLEAGAHDFRSAGRRLGAEPWFSAAVVVALAIGIGGSVSVVGAVTAIAWSQPPFPDPDGVLSVGTIDEQGRRADLSWLDFEDWRDASRAFDGLAAFSGVFFTLGPDGRAAERVQGAYVSHTLFSVLRLRPERGRDFTAADDEPGAASVALVGHVTADTLLGGVDHAVGQTVLLDGVPTTIVGVMPPEVSFPLNGALWRPLIHQDGLRESARERRVLGTVGRLAKGVSSAVALAELTTIAARPVPDAQPASAGSIRPTLTTFRERFLGRSTDPVPLALLVVSGMVLLIGCATAATLLFARSAYRLDEATMRVALGASRARLITQLVAECAVCASVAGLLGLAGAQLFLSRFGLEIAGAGLPPWVRFTIDARVVTIAIACTLAATILGGLAPAWRLTGAALAGVPGRTRSTDGRPTQRWIRGLLVAKVALTLVLLSTSGYLLSGARALWRADQTVDRTGVVTARLGLTGPGLARSDQRLALTRRFVERLSARGDLNGATISTSPPFTGVPARRVALDTTVGETSDLPTARIVAIDPAYFSTLGLGLVAGRSITFGDEAVSPVAVVNAAFAARHLAGEAVGRRIQLAPSATEAPGGPWLTVVGVAPSLRHSPRPEAEPVVYMPLALDHPQTVFVMARAAEGVPVADILRDELRRLDATSVLYGWQTLERLSEISRWTIRTVGSIVIVLGVLALFLAALGVYAVTAYAAARRVKEAGIRVAVGATVPDVVRLFVRGTLGPVALGLLLGLVVGSAASRALLALVLDGVEVGTPMLVPAAAVIGIVAIAAALLPARRVAALDPLRALRCD